MNEYKELFYYFAFWVFIVGLCVGSFLNVVILRGLAEESIVLPPSKCPNCGNRLKWWMNIPVLSYLFLRGKCFFCKSKISIQYPIIEALCGILFLLIFLKFGFSIETLFFFIAGALLIVMSVCDIKETVIIDIHAYILAAAGLIYQICTFGINGLLFSIAGAAAGFLIYEAIALIGYPIAKQRAFGEGDSLIALGIGTFFGWKLALFSVLLSIMIMALFAVPYFFIFCLKAGKKRSCIALICAFLVILFSYFTARTDFINSLSGVVSYLAVLIGGLIFVIKMLFSDMKNGGKENYCMLPFGPGMAIAFIVIMFFSKEIEAYLVFS